MPHRKKHTMRWLRSILAVVLSCLLLCSLLCLYVLHVLERTVVETNTALTAYVQKSVDTRLEELHRYSTTIEITHANTLLKNLRELPGTLPAQAYQLSVTLRDFLVTNKLARGVYLYYPRTGLVVGNMGCFEAASYYALQGVIGGGLEAAHIAHHKPRARVIEVYTPGELVRDEKIPQRDGKLVRLRGQGAGQLPQVFEQRVGVRDLNGSGIAVQLLQAGIDAFLHISRQGGVGLHHRALQHMQDIQAQQRAEQQARKHYGQNGAQPAHGMFFAVRHKTRPLFRFLRYPDRTILS